MLAIAGNTNYIQHQQYETLPPSSDTLTRVLTVLSQVIVTADKSERAEHHIVP